MEIFEIFSTINNGVNWTKIKSDLEGIFPVGGYTHNRVIFCFYCKESGTLVDLAMIKSVNEGVTWTSPVTVIADINEAQLGFCADERNVIWVSYWKKEGEIDKSYAIYSVNSGQSWSTPKEVI